MRSLRKVLLIALALVSAAVIVAAPAFATPNITASSGNDSTRPHSRSAVAPFITPSTNTSSQFTARSTNAVLSIPSIGSSVSCAVASISGYASATHTQVRITSMTFGDGSGGSCVTGWGGGGGGSVVGNRIACGSSSATPYALHLRTFNAGTRSASGSINLTTPCTYIVTIGGSQCTLTYDRGQSIAATYTFATFGSLVVDGTMTLTESGGGCLFPGSFRAALTATYTLRPDTRTDTIPVVTAGS
jgi:hypothetical protein